MQFIRLSTVADFTVADVRRAVPTASQSYINKTLTKLRNERVVEPIVSGRNACWRKLA